MYRASVDEIFKEHISHETDGPSTLSWMKNMATHSVHEILDFRIWKDLRPFPYQIAWIVFSGPEIPAKDN